MKKKTLLILFLLVITIASTTACGTNAEVTENNIVGEEEVNSDEETEFETTEVVESTDTTENETGLTNADIVFYDEVEYPKYDFRNVSYEAATKYVIFNKDTIVCSEEGIEIGYIKSGSAINVTEHLVNSRWYRFENPVSGTDYDYLYVDSINFPVEVEAVYTQDEILNALKTRFSNPDMSYELLDAPTDNMESAEFSVSKTETDADFIVDSYLYPELHLSDYTKFYIEANGEDDENYYFIIYYKDLYEVE